MRTMSYKIETINRDKNHKEESNRKSGVKSITTEIVHFEGFHNRYELAEEKDEVDDR